MKSQFECNIFDTANEIEERILRDIINWKKKIEIYYTFDVMKSK